jgi:hypothetical protein
MNRVGGSAHRPGMDTRTWSVVGGALATVVVLVVYLRVAQVRPEAVRGRSGHDLKETFVKMDPAGNYVECFGTTFLAMLEGRATDLVWTRILRMLDDEAGSFYKSLPSSSLHVTVKNNATAAGMRQSSTQFLAGLLKQVAFINSVRAACDKFDLRPRAKVELVEVGDSIRTLLTMVDDPEPLRAELTKLGSRPEPGFKFHVTLAYKYAEPDAVGTARLAELKKKLELELARAGTLKFEKTAFYVHHSMTKFELVE